MTQGCDMKGIFRVVLWKIPPTFCALAQRSGRAARNLSTLGEAILFVPKSVYTGTESPDIPVDTEAVVVEDDLQVVEGEQTAGAAVAIEEEASGVSDVATRIPNVGRRTKAKKSALQIRDAEALKEYVSTTGCRRKVWNAFFGNERKGVSTSHPRPFCKFLSEPLALHPHQLSSTFQHRLEHAAAIAVNRGSFQSRRSHSPKQPVLSRPGSASTSWSTSAPPFASAWSTGETACWIESIQDADSL